VIGIDEARARIAARLGRLAAERVGLDDAAGRFLAAPLVGDRPLPPFDNAAMDGFAARSSELPGELPIDGEAAAGHPAARPLEAGRAMRIMTGAPLPVGADCVVMREDAEDRGASVVLPAAPAGQHVRRAGEDVAAGQRLLDPGAELDPGAIGMCAALGRGAIEVARRPRVSIVPTGDELVPLGQAPAAGQLVESNGWALAAQVREAGGIATRWPIAPDRPGPLGEALAAALVDADVLVTSGGVSAGDHDHVRGALAALGVAIDFYKVAIRPGKPLVFGVAPAGALVFGLPGNPVSSMVSFELFVRPALRALQGAARPERPRVEVALAASYRKAPGRAHVVRAALRRDGDVLVATPHGRQGSGMLSSMLGVDALLLFDAARGDVAAGERTPALLLRIP
jgi:molybdopterin molybdotransferase